jgi:hypothetical protein
VTAAAGSTAYKVVADIGDTWVVTFTPTTTGATTGTYLAHIEKGQFGLADATGTFTSSTSGNLTTYVLSGGVGTLYLDSRTKALAGNVTVGGRSTTVAGTGYQISDLSKLAGTYLFAYATRNQSNGGSPDSNAGQMVIASTGTTAALCIGGSVNSNNTSCTPFETGGTTEFHAGTLATPSSNGTVIVSFDGAEWGSLQVHPSDFGSAALIIDRYGVNGSNIMRVGTMYATKQKTLAGTEFNGNWSCSTLGALGASAVVSGNAATVTEPDGVTVGAETLRYNDIGGISNFVSVAGFFNIGTAAALPSARFNALPLSTSLAVTSNNNHGISVCRKTS